jgi:hypothetical protein
VKSGEPIAVIVDALAPDLGHAMARASVLGVASRLGLREPLRPHDVARLLEALAPGLGVFVGREAADDVIGQLRAALGVGGAK